MLGIVLFVSLFILSGCAKLKDDLPSQTENGSQIHSSTWSDTGKTDFHGKFLNAKNWKLSSCEQCHAKNFEGGRSNVSCYQCHTFPHSENWDTTFAGFRSSEIFHGTYLRENNWQLEKCQSCHGVSYIGGMRVKVSCSNAGCHEDFMGMQKSPEACNTCHGDFRAMENDEISFAPPRSISGDTATISAGVGAHRRHLLADSVASAIRCSECHSVPDSVANQVHLDGDNIAEVLFLDSLSRTVTANGLHVPNPSYDYATKKCNNVYCHGDFVARKATSTFPFGYTDTIMTGNHFSPKWTEGSAQAACETCHSLPPVGHVPSTIQNCGTCHTGIVDNAGRISDKTKHINGKKNILGQELSF
jgi:predicted CxxxxCH...CXXCH cytochrome family protein